MNKIIAMIVLALLMPLSVSGEAFSKKLQI